jgi:hypothetical protein
VESLVSVAATIPLDEMAIPPGVIDVDVKGCTEIAPPDAMLAIWKLAAS